MFKKRRKEWGWDLGRGSCNIGLSKNKVFLDILSSGNRN